MTYEPGTRVKLVREDMRVGTEPFPAGTEGTVVDPQEWLLQVTENPAVAQFISNVARSIYPVAVVWDGLGPLPDGQPYYLHAEAEVEAL